MNNTHANIGGIYENMMWIVEYACMFTGIVLEVRGNHNIPNTKEEEETKNWKNGKRWNGEKENERNECRNTCSWSRLIRSSLFLCLFRIYCSLSCRLYLTHCLPFCVHSCARWNWHIPTAVLRFGMKWTSRDGNSTTLLCIVRAPSTIPH